MGGVRYFLFHFSRPIFPFPLPPSPRAPVVDPGVVVFLNSSRERRSFSAQRASQLCKAVRSASCTGRCTSRQRRLYVPTLQAPATCAANYPLGGAKVPAAHHREKLSLAQ